MGRDLGRIEIVTVTADRFEHAEAVWQRSLGYLRVEDGRVGDGLAATWGTPAQAGLRWSLLAPASGTPVFVRLVEVPARDASWNVRRTFGWAALEITVRDADALCLQLDDDPAFEVIGRPRPLEGVETIYPMQAIGPSGEVLYLNEIRGQAPGFDLPRARSFVDHVFIVVLGAPDLGEALSFYRERLGFALAGHYEMPYRTINDAFGLPEGTRHRLATTRAGRAVNVEIDQYPPAAISRPHHTGHLVPGMAMVTFAVPSLDALDVPLVASPSPRSEAPYAGSRVAVAEGAAGEWIELVERGPER